jgi:hypothetical protein
MTESNGNGTNRRDFKMVLYGAFSAALAGFIFWLGSSPYNRITATETSITQFRLDLNTYQGQLMALKETVKQNHDDEMEAIRGLDGDGKNNAQIISQAVSRAIAHASSEALAQAVAQAIVQAKAQAVAHADAEMYSKKKR